MPATPAVHRRRRLVASLAALLLIALAIVVTLALSGAGGAAPPAIGAAPVVPADALVYVHLSTDRSRDAGHPAARSPRACRLPSLTARWWTASTRSSAAAPRPVNFARDVRPWLGKEAALALLDTTTLERAVA